MEKAGYFVPGAKCPELIHIGRYQKKMCLYTHTERYLHIYLIYQNMINKYIYIFFVSIYHVSIISINRDWVKIVNL